MPSLVDIFRFSSEPKAYPLQRGTKHWNWKYPTTSWKGALARPFTHQLYFRTADMSTAHKSSRENKPCEPIAKSKPTRGSSKKSTINDKKGNATSYVAEVEAKRNSKLSSRNSSLKQRSIRNKSPSIGRDSPDRAETTTYWNEQLQAQLLSRKQEYVASFMAAVEEWFDRKFEPYEEACDGEGCAGSSSHGSSKSSAGKKGGSSKRQTIGKRQRDDEEDNEEDNDSGRGRNGNIKRSITVPEKDKLYACPYLKYDPDRFGQKRTCSGPGWHELHRLKEHLRRSHELPAFECKRCCEPFATEDQMTEHVRAEEPCIRKVPVRNIRRNLSDGYDRDQAERLKKKRTGPCHKKWTSWFCILFQKSEDDPDLPSPYQDVPADSNWREGHTDRAKYGDYISFLRRETLDRVRTLFEAELDKALQGLRPQIRNNVLSRIPSVANSVQRIVQSDPDYGQTTLNIPPGFDPPQLFEPMSFLNSFDDANITQSEMFDFGFLNTEDQGQGQAYSYQPYTDYSSSYLSDDFHGTSHSSNTSVEESFGTGNGKPQGQSQQPSMVPPQQHDFPAANNPYSQPFY